MSLLGDVSSAAWEGIWVTAGDETQTDLSKLSEDTCLGALIATAKARLHDSLDEAFSGVSGLAHEEGYRVPSQQRSWLSSHLKGQGGVFSQALRQGISQQAPHARLKSFQHTP